MAASGHENGRRGGSQREGNGVSPILSTFTSAFPHPPVRWSRSKAILHLPPPPPAAPALHGPRSRRFCAASGLKSWRRRFLPERSPTRTAGRRGYQLAVRMAPIRRDQRRVKQILQPLRGCSPLPPKPGVRFAPPYPLASLRAKEYNKSVLKQECLGISAGFPQLGEQPPQAALDAGHADNPKRQSHLLPDRTRSRRWLSLVLAG